MAFKKVFYYDAAISLTQIRDASNLKFRGATMTVQEIRAFKVDLLDLVHEQANEPVPDIDEIRQMVNEFCSKLEMETTDGKETRTTAE